MYTRGTGIPRLFVVRNYLNHYLAMYTRLTRFHIHANRASPTILGFKKYLSNYYAMYKRLTRSRISGEFACPAYLGL